MYMKDLRERMLDLFDRCTVPIISTTTWQHVHSALIDGLADNEAVAAADETENTYTLFKIVNNPIFTGMISIDHQKLFINELKYVKKIKYTAISYDDNTKNVTFTDFLSI